MLFESSLGVVSAAIYFAIITEVLSDDYGSVNKILRNLADISGPEKGGRFLTVDIFESLR